MEGLNKLLIAIVLQTRNEEKDTDVKQQIVRDSSRLCTGAQQLEE